MGNTVSQSADGNDGYVVTAVKLPDQWVEESNDKPFEQISPCSDLSNPSQFRHRIRREVVQQTPVSSRRRTSKVMSKHQVATHHRKIETSLPQPQSFYFPSEKEQQKLIKQAKIVEQAPIQPRRSSLSVKRHGQTTSKLGKWIKVRRSNVKVRAGHAKRIFSSCWVENEDKAEQLLSTNETQARDISPAAAEKPLLGRQLSAREVIYEERSSLEQDSNEREAADDADDVKQYDSNMNDGYFDRIINGSSSTPMQTTGMEVSLLANSDGKKEERIEYDLLSLVQEETCPEASPSASQATSNNVQNINSEHHDMVTSSYNNCINQDILKKYMNKVSSEDVGSQRVEHKLMRSSVNSTRLDSPQSLSENARYDDSGNPDDIVDDSFVINDESTVDIEYTVKSQSQRMADQNMCFARSRSQVVDSRVLIPEDKNMATSCETITTDKISSAQLPSMIEDASDGLDSMDDDTNAKEYKHTAMVVQNKSTEGYKLPEKYFASTRSDYTTAARMLQQTFPVAAVMSRDLYNKDKRKSSSSTQQGSKTVLESPAQSVTDLNSTPSSVHSRSAIASDVIASAAFLFSPSYAEDGTEVRQILNKPHQSTSSFSLTTLDSRSRVSSKAKAITIPVKDTERVRSSVEASNRRVRFSDSTYDSISNGSLKKACSSVDITAIESKLSDLTDITHKEIRQHLSEDISQDKENHHSFSADVVKGGAANTSWSYGIDDGVTPLRSGKGSGLPTNSPFLRFTQARNMFASVPRNDTKSEDITKVEDVKKMYTNGLVAGTGLVQDRINALRQHGIAVQGNTTSRQAIGHQQHSAIGMSSYLKEFSGKVEDSEFDDGDVDDDGDDDSFGEITHPNTIDEQSDEEFAPIDIDHAPRETMSTVCSKNESFIDDFSALLLQHPPAADLNEADDNTVSTVCRERSPRFYSSTPFAKNFKAPRNSVDSTSCYSTSSTVTGTTVSTLVQRRLSMASDSKQSYCGSIINSDSVPFREGAIVKPSEQQTKVLTYSSQVTPAMKWRELAAAARAKDNAIGFRSLNKNSNTISATPGRSLSERNLNIM